MRKLAKKGVVPLKFLAMTMLGFVSGRSGQSNFMVTWLVVPFILDFSAMRAFCESALRYRAEQFQRNQDIRGMFTAEGKKFFLSNHVADDCI